MYIEVKTVYNYQGEQSALIKKQTAVRVPLQRKPQMAPTSVNMHMWLYLLFLAKLPIKQLVKHPQSLQ